LRTIEWWEIGVGDDFLSQHAAERVWQIDFLGAEWLRLLANDLNGFSD